MKRQNAVLLFARTPEIRRSVAGEPFAALPWEDLDSIFHACVADVATSAAAIPDADVILYRDETYLPASKMPAQRENLIVMDMPAGEFGAAVGQAVEHAFLEYYHRVAVVLENNPLIGAPMLSRSLGLLGTEDDSVVMTPAGEGRVGMLALKSNHPSIFRQGHPGPDGIFRKLCELDVQIHPTAPVFSIDSAAAIDRLRGEVDSMDPSAQDYPALTSAVFRRLEKKYRMKKVGA
jgi:hypothetical protein